MADLSQLLNNFEKTGCPFKLQEPMKNYTSFHIGGNADCIIFPETEEQLSNAVRLIRQLNLPITFLGRGSNLLVRDGGIRGVVVQLGSDFGNGISLVNGTDIFCPAGKKLSDLCQFAELNGLSGLEFAWGIPGSVGGAIYMNAGAYGGETKDVLYSARFLDKDSTPKELYADKFLLSYRHSIFCDKEMDGACIIGGVFRLTPGDKTQIQNKMDNILERRKSKQPLDYPSGGSTFKRPEGAFTAALIEECGLKGHCHGGAMVSEKHSGFVINYKNASCNDVLELVEEVKKAVFQKTGIKLELEIKVIGTE